MENSFVAETWTLAARHVITGVPPNRWDLTLGEGQCLDVVPVEENRLAIRAYGFDDRFSGPVKEESTHWMGQPARRWFEARGIAFEEAGIEGNADLQLVPLFPVVPAGDLEGGFVQWLFDPEAAEADRHRERWLKLPRASARQLARDIDLERLYRQRAEYRKQALPVMAGHGSHSIFYRLDLKEVAVEYAESGAALIDPREIEGTGAEPLLAMHDRMFRAEVLRLRGDGAAAAEAERSAFDILSRAIVGPGATTGGGAADRGHGRPDRLGARPVEDRSGGRLDRHAALLPRTRRTVVNLAIDLNGQPPIQVFARRSDRAGADRSLDRPGASEDLVSYEEVGNSGILAADLRWRGPLWRWLDFIRISTAGVFDSLRDQLGANWGAASTFHDRRRFPRARGLAPAASWPAPCSEPCPSSCGLGWDRRALGERVSALEQMLGTVAGGRTSMAGSSPAPSCSKPVRAGPGGFGEVAASRFFGQPVSGGG